MEVAKEPGVFLPQWVYFELDFRRGRGSPTDFTSVQTFDKGRDFFIAEFWGRCHGISLQDECGNEDIFDAAKAGALSEKFVDRILDL